MVSKDIIKEHLFDTLGFKNREEKVALGIAAMEIMYHFAESHLELGKPIILENNFEHLSKPGLIKLVDKYKCRTIMVRFHTEKKILSERFVIRDASPERHRGHIINSQYPEIPGGHSEYMVTNPESYFTVMEGRGMDTFSIGCEEIIVDTTDFSLVSYDAIYDDIIRRLK